MSNWNLCTRYNPFVYEFVHAEYKMATEWVAARSDVKFSITTTAAAVHNFRVSSLIHSIRLLDNYSPLKSFSFAHRCIIDLCSDIADERHTHESTRGRRFSETEIRCRVSLKGNADREQMHYPTTTTTTTRTTLTISSCNSTISQHPCIPSTLAPLHRHI